MPRRRGSYLCRTLCIYLKQRYAHVFFYGASQASRLLCGGLLIAWRCSREQPPQTGFSEPHPIAPDSLLPLAPGPVRDTASLPGLCALVQQDYRQENFEQLQRAAALLLARYPTAARALAAQRPTIDSLAQAARLREERKQQRRAQAAAPDAEWGAASPAEHWYTRPYDSDFVEDTREFLTHGAFYGDYTQAPRRRSWPSCG